MHPQLDSNTRERVIRLKKEGGWGGGGREREREHLNLKSKQTFKDHFFFNFLLAYSVSKPLSALSH